MRFEITHSFPHLPATVAEAILDENYQRSLNDLESLAERTVISQEPSADGGVVRRTRCVLDLELAGMARSFIGNGEPAWVEEATWDPKSMMWTWTILPEVAKDLLEAKGAIELRDSEGATERAVVGDVKVKVPLYGGKVEGWIVTGLEHAYAEEAERLHAWLGRENG